MQSEISISHVLVWGIRETSLQLSAYAQPCPKWNSVMGGSVNTWAFLGPEGWRKWMFLHHSAWDQGLWHINGRQGSVSPESSQFVTGLGCVKWSERRGAQRLVIFGVYQKAESLHREPESSCAVCLLLAHITLPRTPSERKIFQICGKSWTH